MKLTLIGKVIDQDYYDFTVVDESSHADLIAILGDLEGKRIRITIEEMPA